MITFLILSGAMTFFIGFTMLTTWLTGRNRSLLNIEIEREIEAFLKFMLVFNFSLTAFLAGLAYWFLR